MGIVVRRVNVIGLCQHLHGCSMYRPPHVLVMSVDHGVDHVVDQVETMLLRVDSAVADNGMVVASVSRQRGGFAPYRLDNCSPETLYVRYVCQWQWHANGAGNKGRTAAHTSHLCLY